MEVAPRNAESLHGRVMALVHWIRALQGETRWAARRPR
jgi:hypothetical protein